MLFARPPLRFLSALYTADAPHFPGGHDGTGLADFPPQIADLVADAQPGKFRTFLLTAIDRFLIDRRRRERARKRSPQGAIVEIDDPGELAGQGASPSDAFDAAWAREVLAEVIRRMRAECEASRTDLWAVFECRLLNPMLEGAEPVEYEALAGRFRLQSPTQAANLLVTAKRMFVRAMRAVVGEYVLPRDSGRISR